MNLATADSTVDYVNTGAWSKKAIGEAKRYCKVSTWPPTRRRRTTRPCPRRARSKLTPDAAYFHYTPNETIGGVEFDYVPDRRATCRWWRISPRTILSRPLDVSRFGAHLRRRAEEHRPVGHLRRDRARRPASARRAPARPSVWDFKAMADEGSMLNTPPTFGWYFAGLVFKWLKKQGGLAGHGAAQSRQGGEALRLHRWHRRSTQTRWRRTRARG